MIAVSLPIWVQLILITGVGLFSQLIAHTLGIPAIVLLLASGLMLGPIGNLVEPDLLFSDHLLPFVSFSVSIILFEGGLSLLPQEGKVVGRIVSRLVTLGVFVTIVLLGLAAHFILKLDWGSALLLAAILSVSGPTVITPLLNQVRVKSPLDAILRWEGILIDPVGVVVSVVIFEALISQRLGETPILISTGIISSLSVGLISGALAGIGLAAALKRYLIPDHLFLYSTLLTVFLSTRVANAIVPESGLLAAIILGATLRRAAPPGMRHITHVFDELRELLISLLFIVLTARLELTTELNWYSILLFVVVSLLFVRPISVFVSTIGSGLSLREKGLLASVMPRGIVAASIASLLAFELKNASIQSADQIVVMVFVMIVASVMIYGLGLKPVAKALNLLQRDPQGILIVGAHKFARLIGLKLKIHGVRVLMIDTNPRYIAAAKKLGLECFEGSILAADTLDLIDLDGIGKLLTLTSNEELNALAALDFHPRFGRASVFQIALSEASNNIGAVTRGRVGFGKWATFEVLSEKISKESDIIVRKFEELSIDAILPLFRISNRGELSIFSEVGKVQIREGDIILGVSKDNSDSVLLG